MNQHDYSKTSEQLKEDKLKLKVAIKCLQAIISNPDYSVLTQKEQIEHALRFTKMLLKEIKLVNL